MNTATIILCIVVGYAVWLLYEFHNPTNQLVKNFIKKSPKIALLIGVVLVIFIYGFLISCQDIGSRKEQSQDCDYDAYHGWNCN
jgi:uncharacterized membrane protein YdjX (TVP38/TMEM64 family)